MTTHVHLVGSIGLDTTDDVFTAVGELLGPHLKRVPDGEPGGRRMWVNWQFPLLRGSPFLKVDGTKQATVTGCVPLTLADGVRAEDVHFGELGYAREARASYQDFLDARRHGRLPANARFQVCLPTPFAVITSLVSREARPAVEAAYEDAMIREAETICAAIPHADLCVQWDICIEMIAFDGRTPWIPSFPQMERYFAERIGRLSAVIPSDVELGFHLCYGDLDAKHTIEPLDAGKMVEMAQLIAAAVPRSVTYIHMPVPVERTDDAFYAPLEKLRLPASTELFLGLVHAKDGIEGTKRRIAAAKKFIRNFGVASECGISRVRTNEAVMEMLRTYAAAAKAAEV